MKLLSLKHGINVSLTKQEKLNVFLVSEKFLWLVYRFYDYRRSKLVSNKSLVFTYAKNSVLFCYLCQ